jgi:hypothetical protein
MENKNKEKTFVGFPSLFHGCYPKKKSSHP